VANDGTTEPALIAVQEYTLAELAQVEHPVLARALHRVLTEAEGTDSPLAAFDNYI
jgi:FXSXX-COOH protein